jgi:acyl dehydratase
MRTLARYFEDFNLGEEFTTPGRTIDQSDVANFAGLSGDYYSLHTNDVYAKTTAFHGRVAHGLLTLSVVSGLWHRLGLYDDQTQHTLVAFCGIDKLRFTAPVRPGDTIGVKLKITDKQDRGEDGLVSFLNEVTNQDDKVVLVFTAHLLFKKRSDTTSSRKP